MTTCAICGLPFEGKTSYGLCPLCLSRDKMREFDRLEAAIRHTRREGFRASLSLVDWLSILSDFNGRCAWCLDSFAQYIERVDTHKGLDKGNVAPCCAVCHLHRERTWQTAEARVAAYLDGKVTFRVQGLDWYPAPEEVSA